MRRKKLMDFLAEPYPQFGVSEWVWHGTLEIYVRKTPTGRWHMPWDICIATVTQHGRMGRGAFWRLLDELEQRYTIQIENVLNERLNESLRRRGYTQANGDSLSLIRRR